MVVFPRWLGGAIVVLAAALLGGCGSRSHDLVKTLTSSVSDVPARRLNPPVGGRRILVIKHIGATIGDADVVAYGSDGSAVVHQITGGRNQRVRVCRLRTGELARLRRELRRLPPADAHQRLGSATAFYALHAAGRTATFGETVVPARGRPFVRRLERTLSGRAARCRTTYRSAQAP